VDGDPSTVPHDSRQFEGLAGVVSAFTSVGDAGGSFVTPGTGRAPAGDTGGTTVRVAHPDGRGDTGAGALAWPLNTRMVEPSAGS
jgi:hypothetical protein